MTTSAFYLELYNPYNIALFYFLELKRFQVNKLSYQFVQSVIHEIKFILLILYCKDHVVISQNLRVHFLPMSRLLMFVHIAGLEAYYEFLLSWAIFISLCISSANYLRYLTLSTLYNCIILHLYITKN